MRLPPEPERADAGDDLDPAGPPAAGPDTSSWLRYAIGGFLAGFVLSNLVAGIVLGAGGYLQAGAPLPPLWLTALLQIPLWAGLMGGVVLAARAGSGSLVTEFGLRFEWRDAPVGIAVGALTQLVLVPVLYLPVFWLIGERDVSEPARELTQRADGAFGVVVLLAVVVVGAPVVEELFFRGLLQGALLARWAPWAATFVAALAFGFVHFQVLQFPALVLFGMVVGWLVRRTGRLGPAIWAHAAFNAVTVVLLLATA